MTDKKAALGVGAIALVGLAAFAATKAAPEVIPEVEKAVYATQEDKALAQELEKARAEAQAAKAQLSAVEEMVIDAVTGEKFTASLGQCSLIAEIVPDNTYKAAIDAAYERAAAEATQKEASTGVSHSVTYSSGGGYSSMTTSDAIAYGGPT